MPLNKTALAQSILKLMTDARKETEIFAGKAPKKHGLVACLTPTEKETWK